MLKMKKSLRVMTALSASMLLSLTIASSVYADSESEDIGGVAKTSAPPVEMNVNTINPMSVYLMNAGSEIRQVSSSMQLTAFTSAAQSVDILGVEYIFQRWTGSVWLDISTSSGSSLNTNTYSGTKSFSAASGYYYRGKTVHYVRKGSVREEETKYTPSLLMQ